MFLTRIRNNTVRFLLRTRGLCSNQHNGGLGQEQDEHEEFRTYEIPGLKPKEKASRFVRPRKRIPAPRYQKMSTDQDWTNVWPAAATFKQSVVPLPLRQGYVENSGENSGVSPDKTANAELMKIPNFFHLTSTHVKKHCAAIKQFCSEWPGGLQTDEDCERHFPMEVITSDYLFSSASIRDPRARGVTVRMKLSSLELDEHARDKFIRLVGDRYDAHTDTLTFTADRCPVKKQNYDYIQYLLTACYFESWRSEDWEKGREETDMASYTWHMTPSKHTVLTTLRAIQRNQAVCDEDSGGDDEVTARDDVRRYREAVTHMADEGENVETIRKYKQSVLDMLRVPLARSV